MPKWIFLLLFVLILAPVSAQDGGTCPALVDEVIAAIDANCGSLDRNTACYGYRRVDATFTQEMDDTFFTSPADRAALLDLQTIQTAPLQPEIDEWGVAVMSLQANVPNTLPGQAVRFVLLGDVTLENAVPPEEAFVSDAQPVEVTAAVNANVRSAPGTNANVLGGAPAGTTLMADALSADRNWVRVLFNDSDAWVSRSVLNTAGDLDALPVLAANQRSPMQAFYFRTGVGEPVCQEAPPSVLVIQGPQRVNVTLSVNGADFTIGSTVALTQPDAQTLRLSVIDGAAYVAGNIGVPGGFAVDAALDAEGDFTGRWYNAHSLTQEELDLLLPLENLPPSLFNYPVDLPTFAEIQALRSAILTAPQPEATEAPGESTAEADLTVTPTIIVPGNAFVAFSAQPDVIKAGECTRLVWNTRDIREVYFDGSPAIGTDSAERCPPQSTSYTLRVIFQDGSERTYTAGVRVIQPSEPTPTPTLELRAQPTLTPTDQVGSVPPPAPTDDTTGSAPPPVTATDSRSAPVSPTTEPPVQVDPPVRATADSVN